MYYSGQVRSQSALSMMLQCLSIAALASLVWLVIGFSLSFGETSGGVIGSLKYVFFADMSADSRMPLIVFAMYQMTFAILTPALIAGAYAERIKFPAMLLFSGLWVVLVYSPICHWVWGGGWLSDMGIMDYAGGLVILTAAGASALVAASFLGKRRGFPTQIRQPHSPGLVAAGAAILWIGWFGLTGGHTYAANASAGYAIAATHFSAAAAALVWVFMAHFGRRQFSLASAATGAIAGLAAATPAAGFVGPVGGLVIGIVAGILSYSTVGFVKRKLNIDDSLNVFAVFGVAGIVGTLLVSVFALDSLGGFGFMDTSRSFGPQLGVQVVGVLAVVGWSVLATAVILFVTSKITGGLRIDEEDELLGLDLSAQGEQAYDL
jgi:Amt family ammonium transporter